MGCSWPWHPGVAGGFAKGCSTHHVYGLWACCMGQLEGSIRITSQTLYGPSQGGVWGRTNPVLRDQGPNCLQIDNSKLQIDKVFSSGPNPQASFHTSRGRVFQKEDRLRVMKHRPKTGECPEVTPRGSSPKQPLRSPRTANRSHPAPFWGGRAPRCLHQDAFISAVVGLAHRRLHTDLTGDRSVDGAGWSEGVPMAKW